MKSLGRYFAVFVVLSIVITARAEEGGTGAYTPGSFASFIDTLPGVPGFGLFNYTTHYEGSASASHPFPIAGQIAANVNANANAVSPGAFWVSPLKIFGAYYAPGVSIPLISETVKAQVTGPLGNTLSRSDTVNGLGDIEFWPVALSWTLWSTNLHVDVLGGIYAPTGSYENNRLANEGLNYWTFEPGLLVSYLGQKNGFQFTTYLGYDINTENPATDYHSGQVFHMDGTVGQFLPLGKGYLGVGAQGFFVQQTTADNGGSTRLGSFEEMTAGVGPAISYAIEFGKVGFAAVVTWLPQVTAQDTVKGDYVWIKTGVSF